MTVVVPFLYTVAFFLLALALGRALQSSTRRPTPSRSRLPTKSPARSLNPKTWLEQAKAKAADKKIAQNRDAIIEELERQFNDSPSHNPDT